MSSSLSSPTSLPLAVIVVIAVCGGIMLIVLFFVICCYCCRRCTDVSAPIVLIPSGKRMHHLVGTTGLDDRAKSRFNDIILGDNIYVTSAQSGRTVVRGRGKFAAAHVAPGPDPYELF